MTPIFRQARRLAGPILALGLAPALFGCSMFGQGDSKPETTAATTASVAGASATTVQPASSDQVDVRRYLGPDYCPELRLMKGAELVRRYEKGHDDDAKYLIWQGSLGRTARECLWDLQGGLTLKIGMSGRVIAGPKGSAATVTVPLKVAVVKYRESVLAMQDYPIDVAVPAQGSAVFTQVKEILVPSPGKDRDYIIYVGFDVGKWDPLKGESEAVVAVQAPPPPPVRRKPLPAAPSSPNVLPTPTDGFVLPQ